VARSSGDGLNRIIERDGSARVAGGAGASRADERGASLSMCRREIDTLASSPEAGLNCII
jgi:hypothetical protein